MKIYENRTDERKGTDSRREEWIKFRKKTNKNIKTHEYLRDAYKEITESKRKKKKKMAKTEENARIRGKIKQKEKKKKKE